MVFNFNEGVNGIFQIRFNVKLSRHKHFCLPNEAGLKTSTYIPIPNKSIDKIKAKAPTITLISKTAKLQHGIRIPHHQPFKETKTLKRQHKSSFNHGKINYRFTNTLKISHTFIDKQFGKTLFETSQATGHLYH